MFWTLTTTADGTGLASALAPAYLPEGDYTVWGRQIAGGKEGPWSGPYSIHVLPPVRRFEPMYWHINMPLSISASVRTTGANGVRMDAVIRKVNDIVGMKWSSKDEWDHLQIGYLQTNNYVNCILEFDFEIEGYGGGTGDALTLGGESLTLDDESLSVGELGAGGSIDPVLTVKDDAGTDYYIRLANYLTSGTVTSGHVRLNFAGSPVFGGFDIEDAGQRVSVPWNRIVEFSIGLASPEYDVDDDSPLAESLSVALELNNISVTGDNAYVPRRSSGPPATAVRMCDGYDDSYNLCPERIVQAIQYLGYSGLYVMYIGASHLHDLVYDDGEGDFRVNPSHPISQPSRLWFKDFFERLVAADFVPVISQSYEVLAQFCPNAWRQQAAASAVDPSGPYAQTGWVPPSTLLSPCNTSAMNYLKAVALQACSILDEAGGDIHYQIGEPWWWDGSYAGTGPCIYDASARALYTSETGNPVPTPYLTTVAGSPGTSEVYVDWCGEKLGASTLWLRDQVLDEYPYATSYILIFTPQILTPGSEITNRLNLPVDDWKYPAFSVLQLEDYDWIVAGEWELHELTLSAGTDTLEYPLENIQYFGGFNLNHEDAEEVWPRISQAINGALTWGIDEVCVWARPQVFRDGWFPHTTRLAPALGLSPDNGPAYEAPVFPSSLQAKKTSFGDVRMSFAPNQDTSNKTFYVDVYNVAGTEVVRTLTLASPPVVDGRVNADYPIEWNSVDFGFPPTYLVFAVRVGASDPVGIIIASIPTDNTIVQKAVMFGGQSNALGHFTTLSGPTLGQGSAAYFRRQLAASLGLSWVEVMPVQLCWGSSAADQLADDDPVYGVNYWWDVDGDIAGPRLEQSLAAIAALGCPLAAVVWGQGENDASAMQPAAAPRYSTPARYREATENVFAALRAATSADLPIWIQTVGRGYWGDPPDPPEAGGEYYKSVRDVQAAITTAQTYTYIGSWTPGCETIAGYVPEVGNPGWIHYTSTVYMATAAELAEAIAFGLDRLSSRPAWTSLVAPNLTPSVEDYDVYVNWGALTGSTFSVVNLDVTDNSEIDTQNITAVSGACEWTFTAAEQIAHYGYPGGYVHVIVYQTTDGVRGPSSDLVFNPADLPGYITAPTGLTAYKNTAGDIIVEWDGDPGDTFRVRNISVVDSSEISNGNVTGPQFVFDVADQTYEYGFPTNYIAVYVAKVAAGTPGPEAYFSDDLS